MPKIFDAIKKAFSSEATAEAVPVKAQVKPIGLLNAQRDFDPKVRQAIEKLNKQVLQRTHTMDAPDGVATMDGVVTDSGASVYGLQSATVPLNLASWYATQSFIGWQMCATLSQHWLIDKACSMPARDAARNGYELTVNDGTEVDPEIIAHARKLDKKYKVNKNLIEFVRMGRVFGIRVAMFDVRSTDGEYYEKPYNPDGITPGSYRGIVQIDPYWMAPELDANAAADPTSINFFEPTFWVIRGKRIHRSHLIIFRGPEVPDVLKPSYFYGGLSVPQRIYERVYAAERTANEAPLLAMSKRTMLLKTDVTQALANQESLEEALNQFSYYWNNYGVKVLGEGDEMSMLDTSLADLDAVIMTQYQIVASIAGVPATKLLGTSPKGFNSTGEHEIANYHEELESVQSNDMERLLERHYEILVRSELTKKFSIQPFEFDITWNPLTVLSATEQAELNERKANTDKTLQDAGAIDGYDIRARLIADRESGYTGLEIDEPLDLPLPDDDLDEDDGEESPAFPPA